MLFLNWRDTRHPEGGGSEVYVERVAGELVARGHRVTLLCAAHDQGSAEETTASGIRLIRRGGRGTVYAAAALTLLAGRLGTGPLAGRRPDLVVDVCNGVPFLSPLYAGRPTVVLVHHVHREQWPVVLGRGRARFGWWLESALAPRVYRRCRYVAVSAATRDELAGLGVAESRIEVIHNGTPEVIGAPVRKTPYPSLLVLGRLVPHKRVELALRALATLSAELPGLELVVAGQGWWADRLRAEAAALGVADRTRFTGYVSEADKHALLGSAWAVVVPSLKEGWGLTVVEAGARGTPAVAFRGAGGVREAVVDGRTGLLAGDPDDFVAQLRRLLTDGALRRRLGEAARAHAASFTWAAAGAAFARVVEPIGQRVP
ncbi:glycosyltransferase family 4 protein [Phytohabitans rumicis]|uniref:glycosyltransferase family 4 protein n=1 Tax=Phytohabitans rumicis TaxID=1076125 RepID=UPI0015673B13|nr:glycosyltransferase family 4 protein [Phytohabitans rumicis]